MARAWKTCATLGCPELVPPGTSRCADCTTEAEQRRGTATQRGYGKAHRLLFREGVLARDPICVLCLRAPSTDADHWPLERDELIRQGKDPNDPKHGRGLCHSCHTKETNRNQMAGWRRNN